MTVVIKDKVYVITANSCQACGNDSWIMITSEPPKPFQLNQMREKASCAKITIIEVDQLGVIKE